MFGKEDLRQDSRNPLGSEKYRGSGTVPMDLLVEVAQAVFSKALTMFTMIYTTLQ